MDADAQTRLVAAIDEALAPAKRIGETVGPLNASQLGAAVISIRQALLVVAIGLPPAPPAASQIVTDAERSLAAAPDAEPSASEAPGGLTPEADPVPPESLAGSADAPPPENSVFE